MRQSFGTMVLAVAAIFGVLTALWAGLRPEGFARSLGLSIENSGGLNEVRAQYAGFFLACGVVCVAALAGMVPRPAAFLLLVTVFAGLVSGRVVSLALNGGVAGYPSMIVALYGIDSLGLVVSAMALKWSRG
jgi:hypothetical protein